MLDELEPQTANEAALASRAVIAHHASAACFSRAVLPDMPPALQSQLIGKAMALSRLSSQLIKALRQGRQPALAEAGFDPMAMLAAFGEFNPMQSGEAPPQKAPAQPRTSRPAAPANPAATVAARPDLLMQAIMSGAGFAGGKFAAG
jgi:hypothetical protein